MDIRGKSALVTGGAVRVGKAISMGLAKAGAKVAVHYNKSKDEAQKTVSEIEAFGGQAFALKGFNGHHYRGRMGRGDFSDKKMP